MPAEAARPAPPRQAAILVGGKGTRLGALTSDIPKPLMDVAGRPFLDWLIEEVARHGLARITLLAGHFGDQIAGRYDGRTIRGAAIEVLIEPEPLGTAGALRVFADRLDPTFLLLNGDTLFPINLLDLPMRMPGGSRATLALRRTAPGARFETVELAQDGAVLGFRDRSEGRAGPINGGIYLLDRDITAWIGDGPVSLERDVFPRLAAQGLLHGAVYDAPFIDIGIPEDLARAQVEIPAMARRPAAFLDRDGVLIEDSGYPHDPAEVRWLPQAKAAVKRLNDAGFHVFVVTNQAGVARGYYAEEQVGVLHRWMSGRLAEHGAHVDAFEYCPDHPDGVVEQYRRSSRRRKPEPGMILDLLEAWPVDLSRSFMIGDRHTDVAAAAAAGIVGHLLTDGAIDDLVIRLLAGMPQAAG